MLKRFKQELVFIPLMLVLIELFRTSVYYYYPDTAMFDRGSELETYLTRVWQIVWITCGAWMLLWVTFPAVHKSLKDFYQGFDKLESSEKRNISLKFFFCFFFGLVFLISGRASEIKQSGSNHETLIRAKLVDTLISQLCVRELTGNNDGVDVEKYLAFVGQKKGASWCAAFTSYNLNAVGISTPPNPKSAWAPCFAVKHVIWSQALEKQRRLKVFPMPGDCFTIYNANLKRVGHVGFIVGTINGYWITIEGNTGLNGSREGSGVHKLKRPKDKIYAITNYISNEKNSLIGLFIAHDNELQPKVNSVAGKEFRENSIYFSKKGFADIAGHYVHIQRRQCENYGSDSVRQIWRGEYAGGYHRFATNEIKGVNYQRESIRGLCLQGTGKDSYASASPDYRININCPGEATREDRYQNHRSKVYPTLG
ncbi:MAG: CHAP domain-containing protein [Bacteroidetes bacterium]|nr:CHAP domain-containing protein [Bacteroidota bacterium]